MGACPPATVPARADSIASACLETIVNSSCARATSKTSPDGRVLGLVEADGEAKALLLRAVPRNDQGPEDRGVDETGPAQVDHDRHAFRQAGVDPAGYRGGGVDIVLTFEHHYRDPIRLLYGDVA